MSTLQVLQEAAEKFNLGTRFLNKDCYESAIEEYKEALRMVNPYCLHCTGIDSARELKGMILHSLGTCYYYLNNKENAVKYTFQSLDLFRRVKSDKIERAIADYNRFNSMP